MGKNRLQLVPHGRSASAALESTLRELKGDQPLTPITVAVPHPWAGLSLRRSLATRPGGIVNVRFDILPRITELLGAPLLAAQNQRPRTATITRSAVRSALRDNPGSVLDRVAQHPATEAAVVRLVDDLTTIPRDRWPRLAAANDQATDLVALAERVLSAAPNRYDRHDLTRAAAQAVAENTGATDELGHLVVYLPPTLSPSEIKLIGSLSADLDRER